MAMKCDKCGGIIPDVMVDGKDRMDCKNHTKIKGDIPDPFMGQGCGLQ